MLIICRDEHNCVLPHFLSSLYRQLNYLIEMEQNEEDWCVECSDEEKYEVDAKVNPLSLSQFKISNI